MTTRLPWQSYRISNVQLTAGSLAPGLSPPQERWVGEMERHLARGSLKWYVGDDVACKHCAYVPHAVACHDKGCAGGTRVLLTRIGVCFS